MTVKANRKFNSSDYFGKNNKFLHDKFSQYLIEELNIIMLDDRLHFYKDGIYMPDEMLLKREMARLISSLKEANRNEVIHQLKYTAPIYELADARYIGVRNGIFDLRENRLLENSPTFILTSQIDASYDPTAKNNYVEDIFITLSGGERNIIHLLEEVVGYTLLRENIFGKSFLLVGSGGNGKSTFLNMISAFLGENNISSLSLQELNSKFKTGLLHGKLANIGDDISHESVKDTSLFKKLSTGDRVTAEFKNQDPFTFRNYAKLIFSANKIPHFNDNSQGLKDRLVIVPFNQRIRSTGKEDPYFESKITTDEAKSALFNIAIKGLNRLLSNQGFTIPSSVKTILNDFEITNNPIAEWLHELKEDNKDIHYVPVEDTYSNYTRWCERNGYKNIVSQKKLTMELKQFGYKTERPYINGVQVRTYIDIKKELN